MNIGMILKVWLLYLSLSQANYALTCPEFFQALVTSEISETMPTLQSYPGVVELIPLGHGGSANLYRARSSTGHTFIIKVYRSNETAERDTAALNSLGRDCSHSGFRIPKANKGHLPNSVELEDTLGLSLDKIFIDPNVSQKLKNELMVQYDQKRSALSAKISANPNFLIEKNHLASDGVSMASVFQVRDKVTGRSFPLLIKASNIVVNPITFEMTLVDPE